MTIDIVQPGEGSVGWAADVNTNFQNIKTAVDALQVAPPLHASTHHTHTISGGDLETRPRNVYVNYIIKT